MDRNQAKRLLPIIQAFSEERPIQYRIKDNKSAKWNDVDKNYHEFSPHSFLYRIKPESKYRPFKDAEECWTEMQKHQPFGWVFSKKTGVKYLIRYINNTELFTSIQYSFNSAFDNLAFTDLVPFGVKVEE